MIDRIAALVDAGHREIVLTGVDLTSYGADLPGSPSLGRLIDRSCATCPRCRACACRRSIAVEIDDRLFEMRDAGTAPDAAPPSVAAIGRRHDPQADEAAPQPRRGRRVVERLKAKRPEIAIGADLIAGFPTEDDAMAANTLALLADCEIVFGHIFPFSPRPGTPAARMPQVHRDIE